ncbi:BatA and WFA domain-containing protein [Rhodocaloribacter litoris]|uniref:vWA domain-containing protein n=1 Tax=Rhodocaloribacter litoris TaxID=2558931 RepID=UPI0014239CC5|nr:BatA and WFA domain-containing protein [Rhodocaloribacter litoris]QXD16924.1 BatA and WFA domain-containing protein [Rhodocaloribacter litoris]
MSFLNPLFLLGLGAVLVPVLVHLVRRVQVRRVPFSTLMFLRATPVERVRRRRFQDVLLMAIRASLLVLLALAFARPFIPEEALPFLPARTDASVVLLIDRSYSMRYGDRFERAKAEALRRLDAAGPDDELAVMAFADDVQVLAPLTTDRALVRNVIERLAPSYRPTDFYEPLRRAGELLRDARHETRRIVLISDYQQNGWGAAFDNWSLDPGLAFETLSVAEGEVDHVYLEAVRLTGRRTGEVVDVHLAARVAARGTRAGADLTATLSLDGAETYRQRLSLPAGGQLAFRHRFTRPGTYQGTLALDAADPLPVDDRYFFTHAVTERPTLLLIDEAPRGTRRDAFFLEAALAPGDEAPYRLRTGPRGRLTRTELNPATAGAVLLLNVPALSPDQINALRAFVQGGGGLIVSFGEATDPEAFVPALQALGIGTPAGRIRARSVQAQDALLAEVDLRHPIFNLFAGDTGVIFRPVFRTYLRVVPDTGAVVLARYDTGDPALLERRLGRGVVLAYTSTFNTDWTDFPVHELYVPFVHELVRYAVREEAARHTFTVGEPVPLEGRPGDVWEVRTPDGRLLRTDPVGDTGRTFFRETEVPGHYRAALGRTTYRFSVNVNPVESDLTARDPEEAYAAVVAPATAPGAAAASPASRSPVDAERRQKLWRVLLLLVLALLATETYLAHRRRPSRRVER